MSATRTRLLVRALERRLAPANFTANVVGDAGYGAGTTGDLRYCITQLNASPDPTNTIDATGMTGTLTLTSALPAIAKPVTITGPGSGRARVAYARLDGDRLVYEIDATPKGRK